MESLLQSLKELGPTKLAAIGGVAVLLLGFFGVLAFGGSKQPMTMLYSNLEVEDSGEVVQYLEQNQIEYELRANGTQILVPDKQVQRLRLALASEGIPSQNAVIGYEIFDNSEALGTSNFVHNVNLMRALEGELARTISNFEQVENARVHLVIPKRELFTRDKKPPTASVSVTLKRNRELGKSEIQAIRHLVATSVPGLDLNRITIVDNNGKLLAKGSGDDDMETMVTEADEYRLRYERRLRERLEALIEKTVGKDNVKVNIAADIDFDRIVRKSEIFDPESQVARSVQAIEEQERAVERDANTNVSVRNNLPDPAPGAAGVVSERELSKTDETTNFEISKEVVNHVQEIGTVNRISVAVLVNGRFVPNEVGEFQYEDRKEEELQQIARLVRSAIGYDEERGDAVEVISMRFDDAEVEVTDDALEWLKRDFHNILQTAILGVVAILAILLVIRPLVNRAIETAAPTEEELEDIEALIGPDGEIVGQLTDQSNRDMDAELGLLDDDDDAMIDIGGIEGGIKSSSMRRITQLIDKHPEESLAVLRGWMSEDRG